MKNKKAIQLIKEALKQDYCIYIKPPAYWSKIEVTRFLTRHTVVKINCIFYPFHSFNRKVDEHARACCGAVVPALRWKAPASISSCWEQLPAAAHQEQL